MPREIAVRMAEVAITSNIEESLVALGLGSCIGLCLFDPIAGVAGLAHVVLPNSSMSRKEELPGKFADTAVPHLIERMQTAGAIRTRLRAALVGGAHVFNFGSDGTSKLDIGGRNTTAVTEELVKLRIPIVATETGGSSGRTVHFYPETGRVTVRKAGAAVEELVTLGDRKATLLRAA